MGTYNLNRETSKLELHFDRSEYAALTEAQKSEIKSAFLWSRGAGAWVSRSTRDHYHARRVAESLNLEKGEDEGETLSFAEEMERKAERAEARADRMENRAATAEKRAEALQAPIMGMRGDISFHTQPNINSSAGRAFTRRRERMWEQYEHGMDEYRKSAYYQGRAATARATADMAQLQSPRYLNNRIEECNAEIRAIERRVVEAEEKGDEEWLTRLLDSMEREMDKLAYFQNAMDALGTAQKIYTRDDLKIGYLVKTRHDWAKVTSIGPKKFDGEYLAAHLRGCSCNYPYCEIAEVRIPEGWSEPKREAHPFTVGQVFAACGFGGMGMPYMAWECVSTTEATVTLRRINISKDGTPLTGNYIEGKKPERKTPKRRPHGGAWYVGDGNGIVYPYTATAKAI